jgi:non-heme chloroperoxidase
MQWSVRTASFLLIANILVAPQPSAAKDRFFLSSDGVRLHYIDEGVRFGHTIVFVPGWRMPAWIFATQLAWFGRSYHVVGFDPRGQGGSAVALRGYDPWRRGQDIAELINRLGPDPVLLVGWSLGVLDSLAYVHRHGDRALAGMVLIDDSVGEEPAPRVTPHPWPQPFNMVGFVRGMFHTPQNPIWLERLTEASEHTPEWAARELLSYPVPRSYWRAAIYSTSKPVLYVVRPWLAGQAANLERERPNTETDVFTNCGHALFIDDAMRFDALMASFIRQRVWPPRFSPPLAQAAQAIGAAQR